MSTLVFVARCDVDRSQVLVNGVQGIGTGWSTRIPPHHPLDVLRTVAALVDRHADAEQAGSSRGHCVGSPPAVPPLLPWFRGFVGRLLVAPPTRKDVAARELANEATEEAAHCSHDGTGAGDDWEAAGNDAAVGTGFVTRGVAKVVDTNTVEVSELPVGR
jgi:hypothetical protein